MKTIGSGASVALAVLAASLLAVSAQAEEKPFSAAEKRVFLDDQLGNLERSATLEYTFSKRGTLEEGFDDSVVVEVRTGDKEQGRVVNAAFLTGSRNVALPEVTNAAGNPVVMYFLERDVRQMERLTSGKQNFFRRRIRLALADTAQVRPVSIRLDGRELAASEVTIQPYLDDPVRERFAKFEKKTYTFVVSDQVPGGVYQLRTTVLAADAQGAPLMDEQLTFSRLRR